jgi:hypothetical protein
VTTKYIIHPTALQSMFVLAPIHYKKLPQTKKKIKPPPIIRPNTIVEDDFVWVGLSSPHGREEEEKKKIPYFQLF